MAKELDKFNKAWAKIKKDTSTLSESIKRYEAAIGQTASVRNEGCLQLGLEIQRCKDAGMQGKTVYDFDSDKEVKACLASINDFQGQIENELKKAATLKSKDIADLKKRFYTLKSELKAEIDNRDKKASRKVASVDSKSLPDMKKLHKEIEAYADREFTKIDFFEPETVGEHQRELDKKLKATVTKTKEQKLDKFERQMMEQGLNERVIGKNLKAATQIFKVVIGHCMVCEEAIKTRQNDYLMENKVLAAKEFKKFKELVDPYMKAAKSDFLGKQIKGDAKLTKQIASFTKMYDEARKEMTTIANARLTKG